MYIYIYMYYIYVLYIYIWFYIHTWVSRFKQTKSIREESYTQVATAEPGKPWLWQAMVGWIEFNTQIIYPLVMTNIAMENPPIFHGKTHYKWLFSIAMLNYQMVDVAVCLFLSLLEKKEYPPKPLTTHRYADWPYSKDLKLP